MRRFLSKNIPPRVLRTIALTVFALLLLPVSGLFLLLLAPFVFHALIGFRLTPRRVAIRASLSPSMLLLALVMSLWIRSHQVMSYLLVSIGHQRFIGTYLFPNVVEIGVYSHDPAGLKYLKEGVTGEIADVMTADVRRFQTFGRSDQVYDCFCFFQLKSSDIHCRNIPVVDGYFSVGSIYSGLYGDGWTKSSFYSSSGIWRAGYSYSSHHVGFHFVILLIVASPFFVRGLLRWRRYEQHLHAGLCTNCGYDLRGSKDRCPECGSALKKL